MAHRQQLLLQAQELALARAQARVQVLSGLAREGSSVELPTWLSEVHLLSILRVPGWEAQAERGWELLTECACSGSSPQVGLRKLPEGRSRQKADSCSLAYQ